MISLLLLLQLPSADTLGVPRAATPPTLDGRVSVAEWGAPSLTIARPAGTATVWLRHDSAGVYLAALLPDSTFYWGDDLVLSLDVAGDRHAAPDHDDFQWYFRRVLDSSVVYRGRDGRWQPPRDDPDWRLGAEREGGGWLVRGADARAAWSVEMRWHPGFFAGQGGRLPALALRVYDDAPHGWHTWPEATGLPQPTLLERRPDRWVPVKLLP